MMVAARPVDSNPVATVWGQEIHDAVHDPDGVWVTGGATAILTSTRTLPIDTVVRGDATYADTANDQIVIPAGKGGIYVFDYALYTNVAMAGSSNLLIEFQVSGANVRAMGGYTVMVASSTAAFMSRFGHIALADGDTVKLTASMGAGATNGQVALQRLVCYRVLQGW